MRGKADRLARVARIRSLQKRQALAEEARVLTERDQIRQMANRIATLRRAYTPVEAEAESFSLKSLAHQYERLGKALAATLDREDRANRALAESRAETLAAHMRKRAADELAARAAAGELVEADRRAERSAVPRRVNR